jgi:hypothetical protein
VLFAVQSSLEPVDLFLHAVEFIGYAPDVSATFLCHLAQAKNVGIDLLPSIGLLVLQESLLFVDCGALFFDRSRFLVRLGFAFFMHRHLTLLSSGCFVVLRLFLLSSLVSFKCLWVLFDLSANCIVILRCASVEQPDLREYFPDLVKGIYLSDVVTFAI